MRQADKMFPAGSWCKSTYSGTQTECVEVAHTPDAIGVRDTKHRGGGSLHVPAQAWRAFTTRD